MTVRGTGTVYSYKMDKIGNETTSSETFTAEQVREILRLNDDYSNSSSSSDNDSIFPNGQSEYDYDTLNDTYESGSEDENIIPPSPKWIKRINQSQNTKKMELFRILMGIKLRIKMKYVTHLNIIM